MDRRKQMEDTDGGAPEDTTPNGRLPSDSWTAPRGSADDAGEFAGEFEDQFEDEFEAKAGGDEADSSGPFEPLEPEPAPPPRSGPPRPRGSNGISRSMPPAEPGLLSGWAERAIHSPDAEQYEGEYDGEPVPESPLLDSNQLDEWADSQGDTLLTKMEMDWDEEEAQTTLREGSTILPPAEREPDAAGQFGDAEYGDAREYPAAAQNLFPFRQSALNAPSFSFPDIPAVAGARPIADDMFSAFGHQVRPARRKLWYVVAAGTGVALAFVVHALFGPTAPATAIVVTKPADATVAVDGRVLSGQSSPFTVQGLAPDVDHTFEVRREGFEPQTRTVRLSGSDTKTLPEFELKAIPVLTGFTLESVPAGASVLVDNQKLAQSTPVRLTDLQPGPHIVRVELAGYQPWETQIVALIGHVLELPPAQLMVDAKAQRKLSWSERRAARLEAKRIAAEQAAEQAAEIDGAALGVGEPGEPGAESEPKRVRKTGSRSRGERASRHASQPSAPLADELAASDDPADPESLGTAEPATANAGVEHGTLSINSRPWSQVTIDGKLVGNTPQIGVQLSAGRHKVKLVNPELEMTRGFSVDIEAGKTTTKTVEFGE
jgi:eukaryotic-like serine/threonine-protein kinase